MAEGGTVARDTCNDDTRADFQVFADQVRGLLDGAAAGKGYSQLGADGYNRLYEFVEEMAGGPGHALGEIVYKARRYGSKRDPADLLKIAAWAFLLWKHHRGL